MEGFRGLAFEIFPLSFLTSGFFDRFEKRNRVVALIDILGEIPDPRHGNAQRNDFWTSLCVDLRGEELRRLRGVR